MTVEHDFASRPASPPGAPDERLRPTERIQHAIEFQKVFRGGKCFRDPRVRIHYRESGRELSRLGLVVSKKVGNAVARNRLKRLIREVFRRSKGELPVPVDVVVVPDRSAAGLDLAALRDLFRRFAARQPAPARPAPTGKPGR